MQEITRHLEVTPELVTLERDGKQRRVIRGVAAVYYDGTSATEFNLGAYVERIQAGAFDDVLRSNPDVRARVNHKETIARTPNTLKVWSSRRGLEYEAEIVRSRAGDDAWENVSSRIIRGSSFQASVDLNKDATWSKEGDKKVLTIKRFSKLSDVAPVEDPAYVNTDCMAIVRSLEEWLAYEETQTRLARAKKYGDATT